MTFILSTHLFDHNNRQISVIVDSGSEITLVRKRLANYLIGNGTEKLDIIPVVRRCEGITLTIRGLLLNIKLKATSDSGEVIYIVNPFISDIKEDDIFGMDPKIRVQFLNEFGVVGW